MKQVPQNFMKAFNVDDIIVTPQLLTSYKKINIVSEKIINYRVTSQSHNCCQISIIVREGPGILVIYIFFFFLKCHSKIFKLLEPVYSYACIFTSPYQFDKKLTKHFAANIWLFKVRAVTNIFRSWKVQFLERKLARRESIVSCTLSGRVTELDSTLRSELESFLFKSHWCARSGFGTQPNYKAPGKLWVVLQIVF